MDPASGLEIIEKYNWQVPRYTSYPPAPHFTQKPEAARTRDMIVDSNRKGPRHASIYFHIPFCPKRCLFCGCHTEIGRPGAFIRNYMETLDRELDLLLPLIDKTRPITQVHFGGGTPNAVPYSHLKGLLRKLKANLSMAPDAEIAIECDPNLLTLEKVGELAAMGCNRLSIGIQDFDPHVLAAVNRRFPRTSPLDLFRAAHAFGFEGNNLDLIYGLPHQTAASFRLTIQKAIDAGPDRISLFPYAHVPWVKDHQSALTNLPMPGARERLEIAWESRLSLEAAGFVAIGMDHFAWPGDELAIAAREGGLHRNFQGYCTSARAGQVYALGASAISQLHEGYIQNAKDLDRYLALVNGGSLSHETAYRMRPEDMAVRSIINGLLCNGEARLDTFTGADGLTEEWLVAYLVESLTHLTPLQADGLVVVEGNRVQLTENGRYAARAVASAFDPMLKPRAAEARAEAETQEEAEPRPRYSQAI